MGWYAWRWFAAIVTPTWDTSSMTVPIPPDSATASTVLAWTFRPRRNSSWKVKADLYHAGLRMMVRGIEPTVAYNFCSRVLTNSWHTQNPLFGWSRWQRGFVSVRARAQAENRPSTRNSQLELCASPISWEVFLVDLHHRRLPKEEDCFSGMVLFVFKE